MFEPENDIERVLLRATDPAARTAFLRALMDAQIFIVLIPEGGPIVPDANGNATIPEGTTLKLATAQRGDEAIVPFFSAPARARAWFQRDHIVAPEKTRVLFERVRDGPLVLNPGTAGKEFTRSEVARLLAGNYGEAVNTVTIDKPTNVLLAQPAEYPTDLTSALSRVYSTVPQIKAAYLAQVTFPGEAPHLLVAVDADMEWRALMDQLRPHLKATLPPDRLIDFTPLAGSSFESYFQSVAPFFARNSDRDKS
jgi:hypothetical protein